MAKGLASFPENKRRDIAERRARGNTKGNSYWGALDYLNKKKPAPQPLKAESRGTE